MGSSVKGGGKQQATGQEVTQSNLPAYLQEPYKQFLGSVGSTFYNNNQLKPFASYTDQRYADPTQLYQQYFGNAQGLGSKLMNQVPSNLGQQWTDPGVSKQWMDPYEKNVLQTQLGLANQQYDEQQAGRNQQAIQAGAFGGDRQAVADSLSQRDFNQQNNQMVQQGMQQAYTTGMQGFMTQQQQNQNLANLGLAGLGAQGQAAAAQQQFAQNPLEFAYQQWQQKQLYPWQQLSSISGLLGGVPATVEQTRTAYEKPNVAKNVASTLGNVLNSTGK